jgi:hypothetical protein
VRSIISVTMVPLLWIGTAFADGLYDGTWQGVVEGSSEYCTPGTIIMHISDRRISGGFEFNGFSIAIDGMVAPDGSVQAGYNQPDFSVSATITGKITGDNFMGQLKSSYGEDCIRNVNARRS